MKRFLEWPVVAMVIFYAIVWIWSAWSPVSRFDWFLENLLILAFLITFLFLHRYYSFSYCTYFCIMLFLTLHSVGAHYSYRTPIDPWLRQWFALDRAYYDRVVHFSFGLLMVIPIKEWYQHFLKTSKITLAFISILTVFAAGAFYELIEMWVAMIVAPDLGTIFIGVQGDEWDTQHDMELALYGSIITIVLTTILNKIRKTKAS